MRIALMTTTVFPFSIGGIQKHSFYLLKYQLRERYQVDLFTSIPAGKHVEDLKKLLGFADEDSLLQIHLIDFPEFKISIPGSYLYKNYLFSRKIFSHVRTNKLKFDAVYAQGFTAWALL